MGKPYIEKIIIIKVKEKDVEEIRQLSEINHVLIETIQHLIVQLETTQTYSKLSEYNKSTEELLENISRLTRYIEYSLNRLSEK